VFKQYNVVLCVLIAFATAPIASDYAIMLCINSPQTPRASDIVAECIQVSIALLYTQSVTMLQQTDRACSQPIRARLQLGSYDYTPYVNSAHFPERSVDVTACIHEPPVKVTHEQPNCEYDY
jgi:hypothetical protein